MGSSEHVIQSTKRPLFVMLAARYFVGSIDIRRLRAPFAEIKLHIVGSPSGEVLQDNSRLGPLFCHGSPGDQINVDSLCIKQNPDFDWPIIDNSTRLTFEDPAQDCPYCRPSLHLLRLQGRHSLLARTLPAEGSHAALSASTRCWDSPCNPGFHPKPKSWSRSISKQQAASSQGQSSRSKCRSRRSK